MFGFTHTCKKCLKTNRKLFIPDAIGYTIAKSHGVKFLTGDKEFEKMANVEFIKK